MLIDPAGRSVSRFESLGELDVVSGYDRFVLVPGLELAADTIFSVLDD